MTQLNSRAASVEFRGVSKIYGTDVTAVDNVSLRVEAGELVTLLGPSGCGKTTTLRMIAGLEMVSSGQVFIGDTDVSKLPATDRDVSMVFQSYALFPHMSVMENVCYGLKMSKIAKSEIGDRAQRGLDIVGLSGYGSRLPSELSGGQQQRVAVARALVLEPQVLLFDEPLSNLDAKLRRQVRDDIREIQTSLGLTVVYVTHDQEEALAVSDRIIVMNNATIAQTGTPRELYDMPVSEFVADFIGEANILDATVTDVHTDPASGTDMATVSIGNITATIPARAQGPGPARVAVRPSRVRLSELGAANSAVGTINKATYAGSHMEYRVNTAIGDIFVVTGPDVTGSDDELATGDAVSVTFAERGPVLLPGS